MDDVVIVLFLIHATRFWVDEYVVCNMIEETQPRRFWQQTFSRFVVIVVLISGGAYVFDQYIKWNLFPKRWGVVEEAAIYRSGQLSPFQIRKQIQKRKIDVIVALTKPSPGDAAYEAERQATKDYGIERVTFPLLGDGTGDIEQYAAAIAKIHQSIRDGKVVLVHCAAGTQRTGGVIASYRILVQGKAPIEAVEEMRQYGWRPDKNPALLPYINDHMSELTALLIEKSVLEIAPDPLPILRGD